MLKETVHLIVPFKEKKHHGFFYSLDSLSVLSSSDAGKVKISSMHEVIV